MRFQDAWTWVRAAALLVGVWGLVRQLSGNLNDPAKSLVMYLSEFTTQSNFLGIAILGAGIWMAFRGQPESSSFSCLRGATVTFLVLTGVVFSVLVAGTREVAGEHYYSDLASDILHKVMPVFMVVDWLVMPPRRLIPARSALWWPVYPLVYCAYSLIRGEIVDWYPYDFMDHRESAGWRGVLLYVVGIYLSFLVFSQVIVWVGNAARDRWGPGPA